jgi:hypothetical protein
MELTAKKYIETAVRYIFIRCGYQFITPLDFHFLYDWWENDIPIKLIWESIIPDRLNGKRYPVSNINYYVKKHYKAYQQLRVGSEHPEG